MNINDLNDPPAVFNLSSPQDGFIVTDDTNEMEISWEDATPANNPWEHDIVHYLFVLKDIEIEDDSTWIATDETSFTINKQTVLDSIGYDGPPWIIEMALTWYVWARDDSGAVVRSTDNFTLNLNLDVDDEYGPAIPNVYFLAPNFPNPFNAETTVRFGIPTPGMTNVSVWDMHGRKIVGLASGYFHAGRYSVNWNADNVTSGVYIVRLQSGEFITMRKMILLR